ncbi:MAG: RNA polymerase factor sigma-54 [Prevotellaceae bacterium]|jgi:RNA polymerase sigma-54 factor|nr:RNA polymerase factor sigma-54 [Prevotellaceae bacterium]
MLKQQLQQKLQQKISPLQIQVIKLLEVTTLELEERVRQEIEENPVLDEGFDEQQEAEDDPLEDGYLEEIDMDSDTGSDTDTETVEMDNDTDIDFNYDYDDMDTMEEEIPEYRLKTNNIDKDLKQEEIQFSEGASFHDFLEEQVGFLQLTDIERDKIFYILGNIDQEGYLRRTPEVMVDDLLFQLGIETSIQELGHLIKIIQNFDPAGVCAIDLQECLLLQLKRRRQSPEVKLAIQVISYHFDAFSKKHYDKIQRSLQIDDVTLKKIIAEIVKLNPKPGNAWSGDLMERTKSTIVPDFILENNNGKLIVHLNNSKVPELHINQGYNNMLKDYSHNKKNQTREMKDAIMFVKQKVESAQWFIDAVRQRQQTLMVTMTAIVDFQREFFLEGHESFLKTMILKDIADITGYDVSTISRVSNSKYIETEFGIFPVKYFFSEFIVSDAGEEISTREIKQIVMESVNNEDKNNPLNDDQVAAVLKERGYPIARRTVAKYREQLNIPVARLRVEL